MNGSVAAEQTPHLSHRDVHGFEIESFNPQLLKEEREGGFGVVLAKEGRRKDRRGKGDGEGGIHAGGGGAQSSGSDWVYVYFNAELKPHLFQVKKETAKDLRRGGIFGKVMQG